MIAQTLSAAETHAKLACDLSAFQVNFHKLRDTVQIILSEWKSSGVFLEFTDHSFSHVQDMLTATEWIIPETTKSEMTQGDWFMLVTAIYLHDIGLLVTKSEFENRISNPEYAEFLRTGHLSTEKQQSYQAALKALSDDERDRLSYQEFVRATHGKRIRNWIEKGAYDDGLTDFSQRRVLEEVLQPLDRTVRRDLALLCESHSLNDIDETTIFKPSQPYGSAAETVNLQYCAAILRTVDLIQIARSRAPSVLYQLINPGNPLSQQEWLRHQAVRSVRPSLARNRDGNVDPKIQSNTVEVHATFKEPDAFFALTAYLSYAQEELRRCNAAIKKSEKDTAINYSYPWANIETSGIDTEGFLTKHFEFELDQHRILDLLTGHTLYNDATVVLRELTQNSLDAVRLQCYIDGVDPSTTGRVEIRWNPEERVLTISDNGTGMSQESIENHLLKVGSSRYKDPKFVESYPEFNSISRFGIGVLSAFMVADDVEITTCCLEDEKARRITLRSVHGKYLIKLLDKDIDRKELPVYPHGTSVKLTLRPTAAIDDVLSIARSWLVFPGCSVEVIVGKDDPIQIGYSTPADALRSFVKQHVPFEESKEVRVVEDQINGVTVAFAVTRDPLFQEWGFYRLTDNQYDDYAETALIPVGTCIEGILVENDTPGFRSKTILSVANAVGQFAPRTNVARSALEDTIELRNMLSAIYAIYAKHVSNEILRLEKDRGQSVTRAVSAAPYLSHPLVGASVSAIRPRELAAAIAEVPFLVVEEHEDRMRKSLNELSSYPFFWTSESPISRSVEFFLREFPTNLSSAKLLKTVGGSGSNADSGAKVFNIDSHNYIKESVNKYFDISEVHASEDERQVRFKWLRRADEVFWYQSSEVVLQSMQSDGRFSDVVQRVRDREFRRSLARFSVALPSVVTSGLDGFGMVVSNRSRLILPGTPIAVFLANCGGRAPQDTRRQSAYFLLMESLLGVGLDFGKVDVGQFERFIGELDLESLQPYLGDISDFVGAFSTTPSKTFNAFAWERREMNSEQ